MTTTLVMTGLFCFQHTEFLSIFFHLCHITNRSLEAVATTTMVVGRVAVGAMHQATGHSPPSVTVATLHTFWAMIAMMNFWKGHIVNSWCHLGVSFASLGGNSLSTMTCVT